VTGWIEVLVWWVAFGGSHLVLSSLPVRRPLEARLGERGFQGLYSVVAIATLVPFVGSWWGHRYEEPLLWLLRDVSFVWALSMGLSVLGFAVLVGSLLQPNPTSLTPGASPEPRGLNRITRHGFFTGVALWGLGHVLVNGWAADVIFFGGLALFVVLGAWHQDARKRATDSERLGHFYATTSAAPFAAIAAGRQRLVPGELPWRGLALGAAGAVGLYLLHPHLFAP